MIFINFIYNHDLLLVQLLVLVYVVYINCEQEYVGCSLHNHASVVGSIAQCLTDAICELAQSSGG